MSEFKPSDIFDSLQSTDTLVFEAVDERDIKKAPNFLAWVTDPEFLSTTILPRQVEIGAKLFSEYCPRCSNPGYIDDLFDQSIGEIKDNVTFLEHGVCPNCSATRYELWQKKELRVYNELTIAAGQRCVPGDTLILTQRGLTPMGEVRVGDVTSRGIVAEKFNSGLCETLALKTEHNWTLRGSKDTHKVAVINPEGELDYKLIKDISIGEMVLLKHRDYVPVEIPKVPGIEGVEIDVNPEIARMWGYLSNRTWKKAKSNSEFKRCLTKVFDSANVTTAQKEWISSFVNEESVPLPILQSPSRLVAEYLAGVFNLTKPTDIQFTSYSKAFIKQLRLLLLGIGIITDCTRDGSEYTITSIKMNSEFDKSSNLLNHGFHPVRVIEIQEEPPQQMYDVSIPGLNSYIGDGFLHHNSGKSKMSGLVGSYVSHRLLKIPNINRHFGNPSGELLYGSFVAMTERQVEASIWAAFKGFVDHSPWFQGYHEFLRMKGKDIGRELISLKNLKYEYKHKNLIWEATGAGSVNTKRGYTRCFGSPDEIGWMNNAEDATTMNASGIYTALSNSLSTMRNKWMKSWGPTNFDDPPMLMMNISSPSSIKDKIMTLLNDAKKNPNILAYHLPTWECVGENTVVHTRNGPRFPSQPILDLNGKSADKHLLHTADLVRVTTESGYALECSANHLLQTASENGIEYKRPECGNYVVIDWSAHKFDSSIGDPIIIRDNNKVTTSLPRFKIDDDFFYLVGMILAEGTIYNDYTPYKSRHGINIYNTNVELLSVIKAKAESVWGLSATIRPTKRYPNGNRVTVGSKELVETLIGMGMSTARISNKSIPKFIWQGSKSNIWSFLSGFLEGDGNIHNGKNGEIAFYSSSQSLCSSIQLLLLYIGVPSKLYVTTKKGRVYYSTRIRGELAIKRCSFVLESNKYKDRLRDLSNRKYKRVSWYDCISGPYLNFLRKTAPDAKIRHILGRRRVAKDIIKKWPYSSEILNSDAHFERIVSVEHLGHAQVYDFTIHDEDHTYWSNGFVSHNCNPDYTYEDLRTEKAHMDEKEFLRDFGAEPPLASNPFISEPRVIEKIAVGPLYTGIAINVEKHVDKIGDCYTSAKAQVVSGEKHIPRMLTFDLGYRHNSLGMCLFSINPDQKIQLDYCFNLVPKANEPINLPMFYDHVTLPIVQALNIKHVYFDRWQSLDQVTRLKEKGIHAAVYSLRYKEMVSVRDMINTSALVIPRFMTTFTDVVKSYLEDTAVIFRETPLNSLGLQFLTVRDMGIRMLKPMEGDDDIFRAFCLGVNRLSQPEVRKYYENGAKMSPTGHVVHRALGVVRGKSNDRGGGGSGSGTATSNGRTNAIYRSKSDRRR